jgi:hypothetical protein
VFYKDGQKSVLKLFGNSDDGYTAFVSLARNHQDNPYFPRFSRNAVRINQDYSAVRTEMLTPFGSREQASSFVKPTSTYVERSYLGCRSDGERGILRDATEWMEEQPPALKEACDALVSCLKNKASFFGPDIHASNIMLRGDHPVFTDPFI